MLRRTRERAHRIAFAQTARELTVMERRALLKYDSNPEWARALPEWLSLPNHEKVDWLNAIFEKLWPLMSSTFEEHMNETLREEIDKTLASYTPSTFTTSLEVCTLGTIAPTFSDIRVRDTGNDDEIRIMMMMEFAGNPQIILKITPAVGVSLRVKVANLQVSGPMQFHIAPLLNSDPYVGGYAILFMEPPIIRHDFEIQPIPGMPSVSLSLIPGLQSYLSSLLSQILRDMMVFPKAMITPLVEAKNGQPVKDMLGPQQLGTLIVKVYKARNLPNSDWSLFGTNLSDPYVKVGVGIRGQMPYECKKTKVVLDCLNPEWDETFELPVHNLEVQQLVLEVYDEDHSMKADDLLGSCMVDIISAHQTELSQFKWHKLRCPFDFQKGKEPLDPEIYLALKYVPLEHAPEAALAMAEGIQERRKPYERARNVAARLGMNRKEGDSPFLTRMLNTANNMDFTHPKVLKSIKPYLLPPPYHTPDINTAAWLNQMVGVFWPLINYFGEEWIAKKNRTKKYNPGKTIPGIDLIHKLHLGSCPLVMFDGIKVIKTNENELILDLHVRIGGDIEVGSVLELAKWPLSAAKVELQELNATATLRLHFRPLIATVPYAAAVLIQLIGDTAIDFKLMMKPCCFLPAVDIASIPGFSVAVNLLARKALRSSMVFPEGLHIPLLDMDDPNVYFRMDLATKVDGMFSIKVLNYVAGEAGGLIATGKELLLRTMQGGKTTIPSTYVTLTTSTRLDSFEALRSRVYDDKFQRTRSLELRPHPKADEGAMARWQEEFEFLVDEPQDTLLTLGLFDEKPKIRDRKLPSGNTKHGRSLEALVEESRDFSEEIKAKRGIFDIPWSYDFWYNVLCPSTDIDPANPTPMPTKEELTWPGEITRQLRRQQSAQHQQEAREALAPGSVDTRVRGLGEIDEEDCFITPHSPAASFATDYSTAAGSDLSTLDQWNARYGGSSASVQAGTETPKSVEGQMGTAPHPAGWRDTLSGMLTPYLGSTLTGVITPRGTPGGGTDAGVPLDDVSNELKEMAEAQRLEEAKRQQERSRLHTDLEKMLHTEVQTGTANLLGCTVQRVQAPKSGEIRTVNVPLRCGPLSDTPCGSVDLQLQWRAFKPWGPLDQSSMARSSLTGRSAPEPVRGVVIVHISRAMSLEEDVSGPRVEMTLANLVKTTTIGQGRDPEFNELFVFPVKEISNSIQFQVKSSSGRGYGCTELAIRDIRKDGRLTGTWTLTQVQMGALRMTVTWREELSQF